MTSEDNIPFPLGQLVGPINGTGNGAVYDYHQAPNGAWIIGIGGGSNALRYFLASDLERKNAWGLRWEGE